MCEQKDKENRLDQKEKKTEEKMLAAKGLLHIHLYISSPMDPEPCVKLITLE